MLYSPLADLEFLALEAQLWHVSRTHEAAQLSLSHTYGAHARYLAEHRRFEEAAHYVERTQRLASSGWRDGIGWSGAIIAASRIAGSGGRPVDLKRALNLLHTWVERSPIVQHREYQAWMVGEIAVYLSQMGYAERALLQSKRAIQETAGLNGIEGWYRRGDYAKVLLQLGRYQEALDECAACLGMASGQPERVPFLFTGVQALLGARRSAQAADWLQQIDRIIAAYPNANHYRKSADALRERLQDQRNA